MPSLALAAAPSPQPDAAKIIAAALAQPDTALDYAELKLTFDALVEPFDMGTARDELDRLTVAARALAEGAKDELGVLAAVRTCLYEAGPWNGYRPFGYDHDHGRTVRGGLLAPYLQQRVGNCVSMPALLIIVADRLGLDVTLSLATQHLFVHFSPRGGERINIEATSGAMPAREVWMREIMPISDRAIARGVYLRKLTRRETVVLMTHLVIEHCMAECRFADAVRVIDVLLPHAPGDCHLLARSAFADALLIRAEFELSYSHPFLIPARLRWRWQWLERRYQTRLDAALALGWEPEMYFPHLKTKTEKEKTNGYGIVAA